VIRKNSHLTGLKSMLKMVPSLMFVLRTFVDGIRRWPFYVKVFNPLSTSYASSPLAQYYNRTGLEKKRMYDEQVHEVERALFLLWYLVGLVQLQLLSTKD